MIFGELEETKLDVIRKKLAIVIYKNNRRNHCVTSIVAFWYWIKEMEKLRKGKFEKWYYEV